MDNEKLQIEYWIAKCFYKAFKTLLVYGLISSVLQLIFNEKSEPYFKALLKILAGKDFTI